MKILYNDNDIAVTIKPVGLLSQADANGGESVISYLQGLYNSEIYPLHRLDKGVSGVMVYAKNKAAAAKLSTDIAEHRFIKEYLAVVHGEISDSGEMKDLLFKDGRKNKSYVVNRMRSGVKEASLSYKSLKTDGKLSLVRVLLHTGRTHQIRVQFSSRKMPLAGDRKYGANDEFKDIGLMSYRIAFKHPKTGEKMEFVADCNDFISKYFESV